MSEVAPGQSNSQDRELLFAVLALQADRISTGQFVEICKERTKAGALPLPDRLARSGVLSLEGRHEIDGLVERKLRKNRGSVQASLAEVASQSFLKALATAREPVLRSIMLSQGTFNGYLTSVTNAFASSRPEIPQEEDSRLDEDDLAESEAKPSPAGRTRQWLRRHHRLVNATAAVLSLCVIGLAVMVAVAKGQIDWGFFPENEAPKTDANDLARRRPVPQDAVALRVRYLFDCLVRKSDVIAHLRRDKALTEEFREAALQLAEAQPQDANELNNASWYVVRQPWDSKASYAHAMLMAQEACRLVPRTGAYINTLGVAQYRLGLYDQALATLHESTPMNGILMTPPPVLAPSLAVGLAPAPGGQGPILAAGALIPNNYRLVRSIPADLAFVAMIHHRLGRQDLAQQELLELREYMRHKPILRDDPLENRAFLKEAEELLGEQPQAKEPFRLAPPPRLE
jgi:hypothetical protein